MICPNCEKPIDDRSTACPHCGASIERAYCPTCGQPIGGASNKKGVISFMAFVIIALIIVFVVDKSSQLAQQTVKQTASDENVRTDERIGYNIITKNRISMGDSMTEEWMIHVDSNSDSAIVDAGLNAIAEARSDASYGQISVYVYVGDAYTLDDQSKWSANLTYVRPDNTNATILSSSEKIGEDIYIRWNR